jgi:hypothetical protein
VYLMDSSIYYYRRKKPASPAPETAVPEQVDWKDTPALQKKRAEEEAHRIKLQRQHDKEWLARVHSQLQKEEKE